MNEYDEKYKFPVYGTQGGGLVREMALGLCVFIEEPVGSGLKVGDTMPQEWSVVPANELARQQLLDDQFGSEAEHRKEILDVLVKYGG